MTRGQKIIVAAGLPVLAGILHFGNCRWVLQKRYVANGAVLTYRTVTASTTSARGRPSVRHTGLILRDQDEFAAGIAFGVAAPLFLLGLEAWLLLGWRHEHRVRSGRCPECGYDLRTASGGTCPECGRRARSGTRSPASTIPA